jgi:hypothetical protein
MLDLERSPAAASAPNVDDVLGARARTHLVSTFPNCADRHASRSRHRCDSAPSGPGLLGTGGWDLASEAAGDPNDGLAAAPVEVPTHALEETKDAWYQIWNEARAVPIREVTIIEP